MKTKLTARSRISQKAFTIAEVCIAMGITAIAVVALYGGLAYGFTAIELLRENMRATQVLVQKLETIRLLTWDQVTGKQLIPDTDQYWVFPTTWSEQFEPKKTNTIKFNGVTTIEAVPFTASYSDSLKLVTVTVSWNSCNMTRSRTMSTLIDSGNGLQSYVY